MQIIDGALAKRYGSSAPTPLMEAYAHFRLDRQAIPCSKATMFAAGPKSQSASNRSNLAYVQ